MYFYQPLLRAYGEVMNKEQAKGRAGEIRCDLCGD